MSRHAVPAPLPRGSGAGIRTKGGQQTQHGKAGAPDHASYITARKSLRRLTRNATAAQAWLAEGRKGVPNMHAEQAHLPNGFRVLQESIGVLLPKGGKEGLEGFVGGRKEGELSLGVGECL